MSRLERAAYPALIWLVSFVVLVLRRPQAVLAPGFAYEDGREFWVRAVAEGYRSLMAPYAGNLHLAARIVARLERAAPIDLAPLVGTVLSLAIVAAIAAYIASDALAGTIPDRRVRLVLAAAFVLLPNTESSLGSPTFLQFYLGVFLVATLVADRVGPVGLVGMAIAGLTGPFSVLLTPLYAARAWFRRDGDSLRRLVVVAGAAAMQLATFLTSTRQDLGPPPLLDPGGIAQVLGAHLLTVTIGAGYMAQAFALAPPLELGATAVLVVVALIVVAARRLTRRELLVLGYASAAVIGAALLFGTDDQKQFINPLSAPRYFLLPGAMLVVLAVVAASRGSRVALVLGFILAVGMAGDYVLAPRTGYDWATANDCFGGPVRCIIPVYPGGPWDIVWQP